MKDKEILKKTLRHYIDLEYYANGISDEFQSLLKEVERKSRLAIEDQSTLNTKLQYNLIMKFIKELVDEFKNKLLERLEDEAEIIMLEEESFLDSLYNKNNLDVSKAALVISGVTASKILFAPFDGKDTTQQFVERTKNNIIHAYETPLRSGYLFSQKSVEVANTAELNMRKVENGMVNGIRTAIPSYAKTTDRIIFLNNNSEVVYCATLDGRTCIVCGNFHNMRYKSITEAPSVPIHENCRCCYLKASEIEEPLPSYEEYFESLTEDEQKHILGASRYKLWKDYNISLKGFSNNGTKLKLDEIDAGNLTKKSIKAKFSSEKSEDILEKQQKVDPELFNRVKKGLENSGIYVSMGPETDEYLNYRGLEAITMATPEGITIAYSSKLSTSGMYEEIIHSAQIRRLGFETCQKLYDALEVEAKQKLLKNAKNYGITEYEKEVIQVMLDYHKSQIK